MMSRLAGRAIERTDEDYDLDDVFTSRASRKDGKAEEERERERAIAEHQRERRWAGCLFEGLVVQQDFTPALRPLWSIQGDTSGCSQGLVDIKSKVVFWHKELLLKLNFCFDAN